MSLAHAPPGKGARPLRHRLGRGLRSVWDFLVGEDWTLAAATVAAIGGAAILVSLGVNAWWWLPALVGAALRIATR